MQISHAVIPAAGRGLKPYPSWDTVEKLLHPVLDVDGLAKPVLQILGAEVRGVGVERVVLIVAPGDEEGYRRQLGQLIETLHGSAVMAGSAEHQAQADDLADLRDRLVFVTQGEPAGLGQALSCAADAVGGEGVLVALADHLFLSTGVQSCAQQLVAASQRLGGPVSSVEALAEHEIGRYGVVGAGAVAGEPGSWRVRSVWEKPTPTQAELHCETAGLRQGHYLCYSGMHLLPTDVFTELQRRWHDGEADDRGELTPSLRRLADAGSYHAIELTGRHQNIGTRFGLLEAQLDRALQGPDRDAVLRQLSMMLARDAMERQA